MVVSDRQVFGKGFFLKYSGASLIEWKAFFMIRPSFRIWLSLGGLILPSKDLTLNLGSNGKCYCSILGDLARLRVCDHLVL